jgi:perosamine synthetase
MSAPDIQADDVALVTQALLSGTLSGGPFIEALEAAFAAYIGVSHAVAVSSGTAGLHLCVRAACIGENDEVVTTPFSFVASTNCLLYERAPPIFVDIDETTFNLDPAQVETAIGGRTKAVLPVHVFGLPCAMDRLVALCRAHGLALIEDACEAVGAEYRGRKVGSFGDAGVFAFYPNKQMTMGEGGIVTTDNAAWAARMRSLRNQGRGTGNTSIHEELGYNYRLNELSAALGLGQLRRIDALLARRAAVAERYGELLRSVPGLKPRGAVPDGARPSWFAYVVQLDPRTRRDRVIAHLEKCRVPSRIYFSCIHLQPYFRERAEFRQGAFPIAERAAASTLALPFHANLAPEDIEYVVDTLRTAIVLATD